MIKERTWINLNRDNIKNNYNTFRSITQSKIMAVVKSNAYGHGLVVYSEILDNLGVDYFGVDSITEATTLREAGIEKPILILGYTLLENFKIALEKNISVTVSNFDQLDELLKRKDLKGLKIHLKFDTGMHRQGFGLTELNQIGKTLSSSIIVEGAYTHFAAAYEKFNEETQSQLKMFIQITDYLKKIFPNIICHAAATSATICYPESHFDMVRTGIGLMGIFSSKEVEKKHKDKISLRPVLSWHSIITEIKSLPKGSSIGYDYSETLRKDSIVGICPVGYWHGIPRSLSSKGEVLVNDKKAKILGRVCMDMIMLDLTGIDAKVLDRVDIIVGSSATMMAEQAQTSTYEIITRINPLIRKYIV